MKLTFLETMIVLAILALAMLVPGCGDPVPQKPEPPDLEKKVAAAERPERQSTRFSVESHGVFKAGYDDNKREILVVTDAETGIQYLSITGCGTTELRSEKSGKSTVTKER